VKQRSTTAFVARRARRAPSRRAVWLAAPAILALLLLVVVAGGLAHHLYFDRKAALLAGITKAPRDYLPVPGDPRPLRVTREISSRELSLIQEGLRGVVRLPEGTAHSLYGPDFPIPVMGKTGTTSDFRDALFVGSTYGPHGITVAVRIGFDDNRALGEKEPGGRAALPIFREITLRAYERRLVGPVPPFPREIEDRIDQYLVRQAALKAARAAARPPSLDVGPTAGPDPAPTSAAP
jgi:membrane peptidoglycan carboxypeptidase